MHELKHVEVNCATGEEKEIIEKLTDKQYEERQKTIAADVAAREAEATAKAEAKASALAKLAALGLTEEEAAAIAG
jgi:hypothetical protein